MASARQQRLEELFYAALDVPPAQRQEFLANECGDDAELLAEVQELLQVDSQQGQTVLPFEQQNWVADLPEPPPADEPPANPATADTEAETPPPDTRQEPPTKATRRQHPEQIGKYRIIDFLAEGGMGIVYRAEQENPRRVVALKVIRPDFATPQTLKRFEYEASVLGRLQHAGIAQIYEAGTAPTESGGEVAFFAMEFVEGQNLNLFATMHEPSTDELLALFAEICDAVEHAHRNGVIHRDIKPANILVTSAGQAKVLDFGVARAVDADLKHTHAHTSAGQIVGTIPYMSPEQVGGNADLIDTRSDVYALGVTLYQLLTGNMPHDLDDRSLLDAVRVIQEEPPVPLSQIVPRMRGDIETIVHKALEKDPERRYASAAALGDDLRRYLRNEPVLAQPPSTVYQLRKLAARHRVLFIFASLLLASLVFGSAGIGWQYVKAEQARGLAETRREEAVKQKDLAEQRRQEAELARDEAEDARAAEFLQRQRAEQSAREAEREKQRALHVSRFLRNVLVNADPRRALGAEVRLVDALDAAADRLEMAEQQMAPSVATELHAAIGVTYLRMGDLRRCDPHLVSALRLSRETDPQRPDLTAAACTYLAELRVLQQDFDTANELIEEALTLFGTIYEENHPQILRTLENYATVLRSSGQLQAAADEYRRLLTQLSGDSLQKRQQASVARNLGAVLWELGQFEESAEHLETALALQREELPGKDPRLATTLSSLGYVLTEMEQFERANEALEEALRIQREVFIDGPHPQIGSTQTLRGAALIQQGRYPEAETALREALAVRRATLPEGTWHTDNTRNLLGAALSQLGRSTEAELMLLESWEAMATNDATPTARLRDAARRIADHFDLSDETERAKIWRKRAE